MIGANETPLSLRRKADECEQLARRLPPRDAETLRSAAAKYRELAHRLELSVGIGEPIRKSA